jgi:hypothetical protein
MGRERTAGKACLGAIAGATSRENTLLLLVQCEKGEKSA